MVHAKEINLLKTFDMSQSKKPDTSNPWVKLFREGVVPDLDVPYSRFSEITAFLQKHLSQGSTILDVACGNGRHTVELLREGYKVLAFDIDSTIVSIASDNVFTLFKTLENASFFVANMYERFPLGDSMVDGVVATQAIYHGRRVDMQFALDEIARVLKPNSPLCFTVSTRPSRAGNGSSNKFKIIGKNEFLPLEGREKGLIHFYPDRTDLQEMLNTFFTDVIITHDTENDYYVVKAVKK